jgi:hypothetical protein
MARDRFAFGYALARERGKRSDIGRGPVIKWDRSGIERQVAEGDQAGDRVSQSAHSIAGAFLPRGEI